MSKRVELRIALLVAVIGVVYLYLATKIHRSIQDDPIGERGLPYVVGACFILGGLVLAVRVTLHGRRDGWPRPKGAEPGDEKEYSASSIRPLVMWAAFMLWTLTVSKVGFLIVTPVAIAIELWLMRLRRPVPLILIAVIGSAGVWFLFDYLLQIHIPAGVLAPITDQWQL